MGLDFSHGGFESAFKNALKEGINLFCGAGFSLESTDINGRLLPLGDQLLDELKDLYPDISQYSNLSRACTKIIQTDKESFYDYLKHRFTISSFNPLYSSLLELNIINIYTTNIDDLIFKIYENTDKDFYLNDRSQCGAVYNDKTAIHYFPLHGCVRNAGGYVFGATEIASAFSQNNKRDSWSRLAKDARNQSLLFWGWNFTDSGPIEAMYGNGNNVDENTKRWVLLYNPSEETVDFLSSLKFNIIIGSTLDMLQYLSDYATELASSPENSKESMKLQNSKNLKRYEIPNKDGIASYPLSSFFVDYTPRWSHIYSQRIPKTVAYRNAENDILSGSDVFIVGIRSSGKTTLMMQLLADFNTPYMKHFMIAPTLQQVKKYIRLLQGHKSLLFVDDAFRDTDAILTLLKNSNIQVICFDRDFNYERQYHKIQHCKFKLLDITEITKEDAQSIINIIPSELKKRNTNNKKFEKDPTIISLLAGHLNAVNFNFLDAFCKKDYEAAKVFLMISYVHACGTPCSFDMVYSFLGDDQYNWEQMYDIINRIGKLIKDASDTLIAYNIKESLMDYYICRSRYLAERIISSLPRGSQVFEEVLSDFARYVPTYKICMYDKFKRSAYDAELVYRAFKDTDEGEQYYKLCTERDNSEYIYQQAALYFSKNHKYKKAFYWIDMARNLSHYNRFSIDSTYSQIYFDANIGTDKEQASRALDILSECCTNDKRKSIHFMSYAKRCLSYYKYYHDESAIPYVESAIHYIEEGLDDQNFSLSDKNKRELENMKRKLEAVL